MATKRKNKLEITPSMVFLNLAVILLVCIICFFVYNVTRDDSKTSSIAQQAESNEQSESAQSTSEENSKQESDVVTTAPTTSQSETSNTESAESSSQTSGDTSENSDALPTTYDKTFFDDDLFIGDSISTGFSLYGFLDAGQVCAQTGLNPETAMSTEIDGSTILDTVKSKKPKRVYIMLGTNGMGFFSASYMSEKMALMIDQIKAASSETKIVLLSIPPVTAAAELEDNGLTMLKVKEYNSKLKDLAETAKVTYIDFCSQLIDSDGYFKADYAEQDGIHFMGITYQAMLSYIQTKLK